MSDSKYYGPVKGSLYSEPILSGTLSPVPSLSGTLSSVPSEITPDVYTGEYNVTSLSHQDQTLTTANKLLTQDIIVEKIRYAETTNTSNGLTAYIGE